MRAAASFDQSYFDNIECHIDRKSFIDSVMKIEEFQRRFGTFSQSDHKSIDNEIPICMIEMNKRYLPSNIGTFSEHI